LVDGTTKGNLEVCNAVVTSSGAAVTAEMSKGPKLDADAKVKYQTGMVKLAQGLLKYVALYQPAQPFATGISKASPLSFPSCSRACISPPHYPVA
jgi:hypothetical protein